MSWTIVGIALLCSACLTKRHPPLERHIVAVVWNRATDIGVWRLVQNQPHKTQESINTNPRAWQLLCHQWVYLDGEASWKFSQSGPCVCVWDQEWSCALHGVSSCLHKNCPPCWRTVLMFGSSQQLQSAPAELPKQSFSGQSRQDISLSNSHLWSLNRTSIIFTFIYYNTSKTREARHYLKWIRGGSKLVISCLIAEILKVRSVILAVRT